MRLAELLTYVLGDIRVVEMHDEAVELYLGRYADVPKDLLKREISYIRGSVKGYIWVCLVREE